jgi:hypothetical protein
MSLQFVNYETAWIKDNLLTQVVIWPIYRRQILFCRVVGLRYGLSTEESADSYRRKFPRYIVMFGFII